MPANRIGGMNSNNANNNRDVVGLEDQRALQLALELTMLGLNTTDIEPNHVNEINNDEIHKKRSQNMTECVPVPSSEHVAEIVGRQGCKIKALRAKTNTYIKTPVRGEEPVFVVTGRKEDVGDAKREILSAAEHFSQIRASRRNNNTNGNGNGVSPPSPNTPGQVTLQVRVPYRVVGLVVGPKGATIKRIQQITHTYIVTPSRDKEPVFEVTGKPEHVEKARCEIEKHIAMRTGGILVECNNSTIEDCGDLQSNNIDCTMREHFTERRGVNNTVTSAYNVFNSALNNTMNGNNILGTHRLHSATDNSVSNYSNINGPPKRSDIFDCQYSSTMTDDCEADNARRQISHFIRHDNDKISRTCGGWGQTRENDFQPMSLFGCVQTITSSGEQRRCGSLGDTSPHPSPTLTESAHPVVRRISSDPVNATCHSSVAESTAYSGFQSAEFGVSPPGHAAAFVKRTSRSSSPNI